MQRDESVADAVEALLAGERLRRAIPANSGSARQRGLDRFAQDFARKTGRQRIDRLDQRQVFGFACPHHVVRMNHRRTAIEPVDLAADDHGFIDRQRLFQPVALGAEEDQRQFARVVVQEDPVGQVAACRAVAAGADRPGR